MRDSSEAMTQSRKCYRYYLPPLWRAPRVMQTGQQFETSKYRLAPFHRQNLPQLDCVTVSFRKPPDK